MHLANQLSKADTGIHMHNEHSSSRETSVAEEKFPYVARPFVVEGEFVFRKRRTW